jgi:16S rRNA (cytosine967-C5)-methyltransferase
MNRPVPGHSLPLSQLLGRCANAVAAVRKGQSLNDALAATPAPERPGTQALAFTAMRRMGIAQALRQRLAPKAPHPWVDALLISALALIDEGAYDDHTLVDQAVKACKQNRKAGQAASGLVNAVLRRFLRERTELIASLAQDEVARHNHPGWWIRRLQRDWPEHWEAILAANQAQPPLTLRANARHGSASAYRQRLVDAGLMPDGLPTGPTPAPATPLGPDPIVLPRAVPVHLLPGFNDGDASVQDASAQRAAPLLLQAGGRCLPAGARILDACAAPGGKTAHLLELGDFDVTALDADPERLKRVGDTLKRLGLKARTLAADASQPADWWDGQAFDAILLDAPCSASGIVRRHPDARWLRRDTDIAVLARTQDAILDALWPLLKPGGHLLYCTCSVFREEGEDRVDAFLQRTPEALRLPAPGHILPVVEYPENDADRSSEPVDRAPHAPRACDPGDGFYYALFAKPSPGV